MESTIPIKSVVSVARVALVAPSASVPVFGISHPVLVASVRQSLKLPVATYSSAVAGETSLELERRKSTLSLQQQFELSQVVDRHRATSRMSISTMGVKVKYRAKESIWALISSENGLNYFKASVLKSMSYLAGGRKCCLKIA